MGLHALQVLEQLHYVSSCGKDKQGTRRRRQDWMVTCKYKYNTLLKILKQTSELVLNTKLGRILKT